MALKIIFMGTPDFAVSILKSIYKSNNKILEVYTQPPKKKKKKIEDKKFLVPQCINVQMN